MLLNNKKRKMEDSYFCLLFLSVCILIKLGEIQSDTTNIAVEIFKSTVEVLEENIKDLKKSEHFT